MKLAIINGPNLNLLGLRQPEIYGVQSFNDFYEDLKKKYPHHEFSYFQSNIEGELIDKVHEFGMSHEGLIINAGAYTHTSIALADAVAAIKTPAVEVHISNIFSREDYRHVSFLGAQCKGSISGFGLNSYHLAIQSFI